MDKSSAEYHKLLGAYKTILDHLRNNTNDETEKANFEGSEDRCVRALLETCKSEAEIADSVGHIIDRVFPAPEPKFDNALARNSAGIICQGPIAVNSHCPHHLYPVRYEVYVAYIPKDGKVLGLSKLARLCKILGRRPILHEQLASEIADVLCAPMSHDDFKDTYTKLPFKFPALESRGSAVLVVGTHTCFTPDTEILTEKGWKRFDKLDKSLRVAQVNKDTLNISLVHPLCHIEQQNTHGYMMHIQSPGLDLCMTPDHDILYKVNSSDAQWSKAPISDVVTANETFYIPQVATPKYDKQTHSQATLVRSAEVEKVDYTDNVYCVTVPEGNIVVRRKNSLPTLVGNCMACRGIEENAKTSVCELRGSFLNEGMEQKFYSLTKSIRVGEPF